MVNFKIPEKYDSFLSPRQTIKAVQQIKDFFSANLEADLCLQKVSAPLIVEKKSGQSDVADGHAPAVNFNIENLEPNEFEVIRSVTKWKRKVLSDLKMKSGEGIYAEVLAIRPDEELSNIHSVQVDQWDWEIVMIEQERTFNFLTEMVKKIYLNLVKTEKYISELYPRISPSLPEKITFISSEDLLQQYPTLDPYEREQKAAKKYGSVFIVGIGSELSNGKSHGYRAPDYDDWSTPSENGFVGLNGDLIVWNSVLNQPLELSSMGIRVDKNMLLKQVEILNCEELLEHTWHQQLLSGKLLNTIGGGIGISRLCMYMLRKTHIGEVQFGVWSKSIIDDCAENGIQLL